MKIIIEGCDGVGKSTLAKKLAKTLGLEYQHDSYPRTYSEYWEELNNSLGRVYDRFFFGQFAGYQTEEERKLTYSELVSLLQLCKKKGIIIIVCYDKIENILKRFKHNDSDVEWMNKMKVSSPREFIEKIQNGFLSIAKLDKEYIQFFDMNTIIKG